ncbi:hypothetical protein CHR53_15560 [Neobacillus mesonae]|uniref:Uncharacterized protein n=1 Tax=Neobacillus mesonae TaxID=1193713 RepID=A0A3T0HZG7_9BACI|nr:hypothetical protein CHR53_15560 [Neobacillus mesonae]
MLKQKAVMNIFFDPEGDERVSGRLCDYEYTIEINKGRVKESLVVSLDCYEKEFKYPNRMSFCIVADEWM